MNISNNWLRKYLKTDLSTSELSEVLTDIGLEVESVEKVESVKGGLLGLVVGEVIEKEKHPDADRLNITKVNVGTEVLQIVCGAANVAQGQKVIVALEGTQLYPSSGESFKIKKSKIRGVESNGMICAEDEIGLGSSHDGIMVLNSDTKIGTPAAEYFKLESDEVFIIGLTPNRIDAASHYGVARDLYAALTSRGKKAELVFPDIAAFSEGKSANHIQVKIEDEKNCLRYSGITIKNVNVAPSPEWLQTALRNIGLRSINNVVDITNYVMHDLGHPLHAFDADHLKGKKIIVKNAKAGNKFITLDEVERTLAADNLMICDEEKELCIAGVFGGKLSGVSEKTKTIFLESAYFNPTSVRKTARMHGLNTDSSFRFERGADPEMVLPALKRAALLIQEIAGGKIEEPIIDNYPNVIPFFEIEFDLNYCHQLIGQVIPENEIKAILNLLSIKIISENNSKWKLSVPSFRVDVQREVDVVEEILRLYGYNRIEIPSKINASLNHSLKPDPDKIQDLISDLLSSNAYHEILSNSLTSEQYSKIAEAKSIQEIWNVELLNPLSSELNVLRQSLLFNGLEAIRYNINRQQYDIKFYEFGKVYFKRNDKFEEYRRLAVFTSGNFEKENWTASKKQSSFYEIKAAVELILNRLGLGYSIKSSAASGGLLEDGLSYEIARKKVVEFGWVKPSILKKMDIKQSVFYAEFEWDSVLSLVQNTKIKYKEISKFPTVRRDLSLLINKEVQFSEIEKIAKSADLKLIDEVGLFDVYEGKNLEANKKSYAISLLFKDESQTLTDDRVENVMSSIIKSLEEKLGAVLR